MSKLLYVVYRNPNEDVINEDKNVLSAIDKRIIPDNITPNKIKVIETENSLCGLFNPVSTIPTEGSSICLGYSPDDTWSDFNIRGNSIEGSFAIIRNSEASFQIVSDMVASRTMWWFMNEDVFLASTSQRAIVMYLGDFHFDDNVIPWMLSSGTIGPGYSYDKRLKILEPNSIVTLNKKTWMVNIDTEDIVLKNIYKSSKQAKKDLHESLEKTFDNLKLDTNKFVLPLSGGYDSRGILLFLKNKSDLKTITWGAKESREIKENDAYIAKQLADKYKVENIYFESYNSDVPIKDVLNRYLICSEGRIDHIGGYLDGMKMWKTFFENGYECILRGDEVFGDSIKSDIDVKASKAILTLNDYINTQSIVRKFRLKEQVVPDYLLKERYSSLYEWIGNLVFLQEQKTIYSALNDIKYSYCEVFNPLFSASIINKIINSYDKDLVGNKKIFTEIVDELCPDIPIAKQGANKPLDEVFTSKEMLAELLETFDLAIANGTLNVDLIKYTRDKISQESKVINKTFSLTKIIRKHLPAFIVQFIKNNTNKREMDWNKFAFRLYLIIKTKDLFQEDSKVKKTL